MILNVNQSDINQRIDKYLESKLSYSRSQIQAFIRQGHIRLNKNVIKPSHLISQEDEIFVDIQPVENKIQLNPEFEIDYLYEDEHLLVLNKPAGIVIEGMNVPVLIDYLDKDAINLNKSLPRKGIVHRLDKLTDGLMVVAKSEKGYESLKDQFKSRMVKKLYYAVLSGDFPQESTTITWPIGRHLKKRHLFRVTGDGKDAITHVRVLQRFNTKTLCSIEIETGRTHQIRVHLSHYGYPVLKDPDYGFTKKASGQLLQSYYLSFLHPDTKQHLSFTLPLSNRLMNS